MRLLLQFWNDQEGATALEYAFVSALVSVGLIATWTTLGTNVNNLFLSVANGFQ